LAVDGFELIRRQLDIPQESEIIVREESRALVVFESLEIYGISGPKTQSAAKVQLIAQIIFGDEIREAHRLCPVVESVSHRNIGITMKHELSHEDLVEILIK
jgi:hypothetical protein